MASQLGLAGVKHIGAEGSLSSQLLDSIGAKDNFKSIIDLNRCKEISEFFSTLREYGEYVQKIAKTHTFKKILGSSTDDILSESHKFLQSTRIFSCFGMIDTASKTVHHFQKLGKNKNKVIQTHLRLLNAFRQFANASASFSKGLSTHQFSTVFSEGRVLNTSLKALLVASTVFGTIGALLSLVKLIEHIRDYQQTLEFLQKLDALDLKAKGSDEKLKELIGSTKSKVLSKHFNTDGKELKNKISHLFNQSMSSHEETIQKTANLLKDRLQSSLNHQKFILLSDVLYVTGSMFYAFQVQKAASLALQDIGFAWSWADYLFKMHSSNCFLQSIKEIN